MPRLAYISGVGAALPERVLTNSDLCRGMPWLDVSPEWIAEHTGIWQRHVALPSQQATDLGLVAARQALAQARCDAREIDMVLMATNSGEFVYPAGAAILQAGLEADSGCRMARTTALDLQQGCASFLAAIVLASGLVRSETCRNVLVVGAEVVTRMVDWTERDCVLLGDGAAACVVSDTLASEPRAVALEILGTCMRTVPDRNSIYQRGVLDVRNDPLRHMESAAARGRATAKEQVYAHMRTVPVSFFQMQGRNVYRFVRRVVAESGYLEILCRSGLATAAQAARIAEHLADPNSTLSGLGEGFLAALAERVDRLVVHGANMVLDQELADQMHIPYERMAVALQDTGNTSAASVGIALSRLLAGEVRYSTVAKRDSAGRVQKPAMEVRVEPLQRGMSALLLSFGAGASWNYVATRAV